MGSFCCCFFADFCFVLGFFGVVFFLLLLLLFCLFCGDFLAFLLFSWFGFSFWVSFFFANINTDTNI